MTKLYGSQRKYTALDGFNPDNLEEIQITKQTNNHDTSIRK